MSQHTNKWLEGVISKVTRINIGENEGKKMAERVGFEPTIPVKVCPLSRRIVSTTHAPLRVGQDQLSDVAATSLPAVSQRRDIGRCQQRPAR